MSDCPTEYSLVQWKAAALPASELKSIEEHVERCPRCRASVEEIDRDVDEYESIAESQLALIKARINTADQKEQTAKGGLNWLKLIPAFGAAAVAATIVLVAVSMFHGTGKEGGELQLKYKGAMTVEVVAKRGDHQFEVEQGAELKEGDALRFVVTSDSGGYLNVFSVDEAGHISTLYPNKQTSGDTELFRIKGAGRHVLPGSIVLDEVIGAEHFVIAFGKDAFSRDDLHSKIAAVNAKGIARAMDGIADRAGLNIVTVKVKKVE